MPKNTFYNLEEIKRKRILDGALKAFSENNYAKVTVDKIVAFANIPKGSFYQYFENKDDLFLYLFDELGNDKSEMLLEKLISNKSLSFSEIIIEMINGARQFENQSKEMVDLKTRFLNECPQAIKKEIYSKVIPKSMELFEKVIVNSINNGEFRKDIDVKIASYVITSTVMELENYDLDGEKDHGEVLKKALDLVSKGLENSGI